MTKRFSTSILKLLLLIVICLAAHEYVLAGAGGGTGGGGNTINVNIRGSECRGSCSAYSESERLSVTINFSTGEFNVLSSGGSINSGSDNVDTTGPMCIVGGCLTCSRNVYEPCPTTITTTTTTTTTTPPPTVTEDTPTLTPTTNQTAPAVSLYIQKQGDSGWSVNTTGAATDQVSLRWVTARANYCQSTNTNYFTLTDTSGVSGMTSTVAEQTAVGAAGRRTYTIECRNGAGTTVRDSVTHTIITDPLIFTATPTLIRTNETSRLTWDVSGRTGCTIAQKANNADSTTVATDEGSRDTTTLKGETTYRLSCPDGSQAEATIKVLPIYSET